jgi:HK97 family phage major capsid protein
LLEDAGMNIENWLLGKVGRAFRNTISSAVMIGDGIGKPQGLLQPQSGIPICETSPLTTAGQFTWQDLVMLRWQVPMQFQDPAASGYLMNQNTAALCLAMSDAAGRPLMVPSLQDPATFTLMGAPLKIATQMPDAIPGATPIAYGNWKQTYMIVNRKAVTMQQDPYSAGFCVLFKFESRIGGSVVCPGAARLLRIR